MAEWVQAIFVLVGTVASVLAFRSGSQARQSPERRDAARRVSRVLGAVAAATASVASGTIFAERGPDDPAPLAAWLLFGAAGVVLATAAALGLGARTPPPVSMGVRGRALVRSIREEGPGINGIPVWELDLDVTAPGMEPFRIETREEIPHLIVSSVEEGRHFPVNVEKTLLGVEVTLDWVASRNASEPREPDPVPIPPGPPLAEQASQSVVFRYARVLLPIALIGALSLLATRWLESTDAEPSVVPSGIYESTGFD